MNGGREWESEMESGEPVIVFFSLRFYLSNFLYKKLFVFKKCSSLPTAVDNHVSLKFCSSYNNTFCSQPFHVTFNCSGRHRAFKLERLLFSLKPKGMAKMRLLVIWINQRWSFKIAKKICDISYTEQKKITGSDFEGTPKILKSFVLETIFMSKLWDARGTTRAVFHLLIWNLAVL